MLDYEEEVISDMSVLHRVDDVDEVTSSWLLTMALHLPHYDGAVRNARLVSLARAGGGPEPDPPAPGARPELHLVPDPIAAGVEELPQLTLAQSRALRDEIRARRYPAAKWGETRKVTAEAMAREGVSG